MRSSCVLALVVTGVVLGGSRQADDSDYRMKNEQTCGKEGTAKNPDVNPVI